MAKELATSHELISSFVTGLSDFLTTLVGGESAEPWTTLNFFVASGGTTAWVADASYLVVGCVPVSGTAQIVLATDSSTYANTFGTAGNLKKGTVLFVGGLTSQQVFYPMRFPIQSGSKLWLVNGSGSNAGLLVYLQQT